MRRISAAVKGALSTNTVGKVMVLFAMAGCAPERIEGCCVDEQVHAALLASMSFSDALPDPLSIPLPPEQSFRLIGSARRESGPQMVAWQAPASPQVTLASYADVLQAEGFRSIPSAPVPRFALAGQVDVRSRWRRCGGDDGLALELVASQVKEGSVLRASYAAVDAGRCEAPFEAARATQATEQTRLAAQLPTLFLPTSVTMMTPSLHGEVDVAEIGATVASQASGEEILKHLEQQLLALGWVRSERFTGAYASGSVWAVQPAGPGEWALLTARHLPGRHVLRLTLSPTR